MRKLCIALLLSVLPLASAQTYVQLILDASGSMWNKLSDGRYRIVAAKDVLTQFITGLPEGDLNVGLRIYGSQIAALEEDSCEDTRLFVPMQGVNKSQLSQTVQEAQAIGATPIAKSLLAAADDFPANASQRLIILVTDGEESCGGDLQAVAENLRSRGFEIDIRIIGFDLDDRAMKSFEGLGTFENAESAEELAQALESAVQDVVTEEVVSECGTEASLDFPTSVEAAFPIQIAFSGPEGTISIHPLGGDAFSSLSSAYSGWRNPAELTAPGEEGLYEVRYTASAGSCVVATAELLVTKTSATINPPAEVEAAYSFEVPFSGPEGYVGIHKPDASSRNENESRHYTGWGNPAKLRAPSETGDYEIRYYDRAGTLLASSPIRVLASRAGITVPSEVESSRKFEVPFDGPEGYIGIFNPDAQGVNDNISRHFTGWGNPAELQAPTEPGNYEIRYYDRNQNVIARAPITVIQGVTGLTVAAEVESSREFLVPFDGPEGYIGIYELEARSVNDNISRHFTGWGNPAKLLAPATPGDYEIRYYDRNNELISQVAITVIQGVARLEAPTTVEAGYAFEVPFEGPEGYIGIYTSDAKGRNNHIGRAYSGWSNPAIVGAPSEAGIYEIRYYDAKDNLLLSESIIVTTSTATVENASDLQAGMEFLLPFSGPEGYIGIYSSDASNRNNVAAGTKFAYTGWGNPAKLTAPQVAGSYELRYYANPKNGPEGLILSIPVTVR